MPMLFIFMGFYLIIYSFQSVFPTAGMEISFLLSCTNPCSCKSFSTFDTLIRVSSIKLAKSSILILRIFFPSGFMERSTKKFSIFSSVLPMWLFHNFSYATCALLLRIFK